MNDKPPVYRSIVETFSPTTITLMFLLVLFMLLIGVLGTFIIDTTALSTLVVGIIFLTTFTLTLIFRQVVMEITATEVALKWGTERVWISRDDISSAEAIDMTFRQRLISFFSLGPWSAIGREKIHYFGSKSPLVLIRSKDGRNFAVSVQDTERVISLLKGS
jgi:hypothetical protein